MERDVADLGADRERDGDELVERRLVVCLAEAAVVVVVNALQAAKALHHGAAARTDQQPVHAEQSLRGRVQEQVDHLGFRCVPFAGEGEGVDTEKPFVRRAAHMALELGDEPRAPRACLLEQGQALVQQSLVHRLHVAVRHLALA